MSYICTGCGAKYERRVSFCCVCGSFNSVVDAPHRVADAVWTKDTPLISAQELAGGQRHHLASSRAYPQFEFDTGALIAVHGAPGSGKTLFLLKCADGLDGGVIYLALEEGPGVSLSSYLRKLEIHRPDFLISGGLSHADLAAYLDEHRPRTLVIDSLSVSSLQASDLLQIQQKFAVTLLFSLQQTKAGDAAGKMELLHIVDVVIEVSQLHWRVTKSRFGGLVSGAVLEGDNYVG